jgi:predicted NACHT family NTPase
MARKSLKACPIGIEKAKIALTGKAWSQDDLAAQMQISRQPVSNFFTAKGVDPKIFVTICQKLELNWQEIAGLVSSQDAVVLPNEPNANVDIDALVEEVREKVKSYIQERCGTMRVLDMSQPIGVSDIYTDVNILEKITGRRGLDISELLQNDNLEEFDRFCLGKVTEKRISGLEAVERHSKLMVLGKPGAGKTTFLKYLAIQCINRKFQENRIPFFIPLKQFAETRNQPELYEFIAQQLSNDAIKNTQIIQLLESGKFLILLDGLDEVKEEDSNKVINQIKEFTERYSVNQFVITCRIASREYIFEKFTEVEVADFDDQQIKTFVTKWFTDKEPDAPERFIQQLESNNPIKELATNPLLLTLLCLEFEDSGDFPSDRAELYNRAIHTLLRKWDSKRGIVRDVRDEVYKKLSVGHKEDLLSEVAWTTFGRCDYFFKQRDIEGYIQDYISNLPSAKTDPDALRVDSEAVLKSIEAHHGLLVERARSIYSFSHLTFHEYFTARNIISSSKQENALTTLASQICEKRWREVFFLTVGLLKSADTLLLLMKQQIDPLLAGDTKLQQFLTWVKQKSESVEATYKKPATIRAFYLSVSLNFKLYAPTNINFSIPLDLYLSLSLSLSLSLYRFSFYWSVPLNLDLDRMLFFCLNISLNLPLSPQLCLNTSLNLHLERVLHPTLQVEFDPTLDRTFDLNRKLKRSLQELKDQVPEDKAFNHWWQENGQAWAEKLRAVMIKHRNIGHDWQFSESQKELLQKYYDANKLLVDCLNSSRYVSREVRQEIEDTLLLPSPEKI